MRKCPVDDNVPAYAEDMARVLVISEEASVSGFVRSVLETAGHTAVVAPTVAEGYHLLREDGAEVILADLHIPGCKDPHVIAGWRDEFQGVKIIALSDRATIADFLALRMMGADDILQMPVGPQELLLAVNTVLHEDS